jgi:hypothetical protein
MSLIACESDRTQEKQLFDTVCSISRGPSKEACNKPTNNQPICQLKNKRTNPYKPNNRSTEIIVQNLHCRKYLSFLLIKEELTTESTLSLLSQLT